jgi:signal transduction histidine kinase/ligand-binding sensor domain-containing protein/AraC-like DNA-binding protein
MKTAFILLACFCVGFKVNAQQRYVVSHLDNTNGLSNNSITSVFQDSDKLLWLNTWDGLYVYNGLSFTSLKSSGANTGSRLPNNVITQVREDAAHRIWICTEEGITKYNKADGSMSNYFYSKGRSKVKSADYMLTIGKGANIVCGLRLDTLMYSFSAANNKMEPIRFDRSIGKIAKIEFDNEGRLWTLSLGGKLRVFTKSNGIFSQIKVFPQSVSMFHVVNHRVIFANGHAKLCEVTGDLNVKYLQDISQGVVDIAYFNGHYFVSWLYKGIQEYDGDFRPVNNVLRCSPILKDFEITSLTETDGKTLWVATSDRGLFMIKRQADTFGLNERSSANMISQSNVQAIHAVGDEVWLGTRNNGIIRVPNKVGNGNQTTKIDPVTAAYDMFNNSYYSFSNGFDGNIYIGSEALGITVYDPKLEAFTPYKKLLGFHEDEDFFRVRCLLPQKDSSVYVGYNGGVYHLKIKRQDDGKFKLIYANPIKIDGHFLKPGNNLVYALADLKDWILIGYRFAGLSLLNKHSGETRNIATKADNTGPTSNNILALLVDKQNRVWIGTSEGLFYTSPINLLSSHPHFSHLDSRGGLPNNIIHAIQEDNAGNIWVSTNQGLGRVDGKSLKVIQYSLEDGLQNAEFSDNSAFKDSQGILYFGGISGYNHFDPAKVSINKALSNLLITDVSVAGKTTDDIQLMVIKPNGPDVNRVFRLRRNENYFTLKVQPADGYTNMNFQYQCFLKGYDPGWRELSENNRIQFSNLPPGDYTFLIKWSNGQGEWSSAKKVFHFEIRQYFWLTAWAKLLYLLIAITAIYLIYLNRRGRQQIKSRLAFENLIRIKEKNLYQEKMDFFTNITHELQTPLTLILGSIERYIYKNETKEIKNKGWNFLQIANQEAFRLQYLIQQLLEFRKAESGHLSVQPTSFNVSNLIRNIAALFEPIGEKNALQLTVAVEDDISVSSDKDKIEKIVFNLLSNAFKYTKTGGSICLEASENTQTETITINIANSGYDGPTDNLNLLFEQFYTVDHANQSRISSGIGLAFSKQLVELLGGTIMVSAEDHWISFSVNLPLTVAASKILYVDNAKSSEKPSYLVKSAVGSQHLPENRTAVNNDLALVENLSNNSKKTILVVEDEPSIRHLLCEILADSYIVYEAENGKAALDLLKRIIPNVIVSDVLMDGLNGLKLCTQVKNTAETCHIPFLLLSALASSEQRVEGFEAGADAYLTKPFSAPALINKIEQLIQYREKIQQYFKGSDFLQSPNDSGLKADDRAFLEKVIAIINENISDSDLDAAFLENAMSVSRMSFFRKIKAFTGMTPVEFIKQVRLKYTAHLLRTTSLTVSEIYYRTGFNNQSYFYREFKRIYNYSPKEFRDLRSYSEA